MKAQVHNGATRLFMAVDDLWELAYEMSIRYRSLTAGDSTLVAVISEEPRVEVHIDQGD